MTGGVEVVHTRRRQRPQAGGRSRHDRVLLDGDDVGEVGFELERELEGDGLHRPADGHQAVLQPATDEPVAADQQRILGQCP